MAVIGGYMIYCKTIFGIIVGSIMVLCVIKFILAIVFFILMLALGLGLLYGILVVAGKLFGH